MTISEKINCNEQLTNDSLKLAFMYPTTYESWINELSPLQIGAFVACIEKIKSNPEIVVDYLFDYKKTVALIKKHSKFPLKKALLQAKKLQVKQFFEQVPINTLLNEIHQLSIISPYTFQNDAFIFTYDIHSNEAVVEQIKDECITYSFENEKLTISIQAVI
jgi:hypothetical protein